MRGFGRWREMMFSGRVACMWESFIAAVLDWDVPANKMNSLWSNTQSLTQPTLLVH